MKRLLVAIWSLFSCLAAFSQATQVDAVKLVKNGPAGYYYRANAGGTANEWASPATVLASLGGVSGTGVSGRFALWNGTNALTSDASITYGLGVSPFIKLLASAGDADFGVQTNTSGTGARFSWTNSTGNTWYAYSNNANGNDLRFFNGGADLVAFKADGKVGIGTTSPAARLSVVENSFSAPVALFENTNTNGQTVRIKHGSSDSNRFPLVIETPAGISYFDSRGFLGLNTVPIYIIHAKGTSGMIARIETTTVHGDAGFDWVNTGQWWRTGMNTEGGVSDSYQIRNVTNGTYPFTVRTSGNIGFNTLDPTATADVNGTARIRGILSSDVLIGTGNRLPWATASGALGFADASITTSSTQVAIAAQGTRNMRIGAGGNTILATGTDRNLEIRDDGSIQLHGGLTADPSSPNVAAIWWNSTSTRAKYRKDGSTNRTIANIEDDILGLADAIIASTHTPGGTTRLVRYDANANAVAVELGASLEEYQKYTFPCTRNATNAVTFSAASGYSFRESGNATLFTTTLTAAAHTTYVGVRVGTVIYIGKL